MIEIDYTLPIAKRTRLREAQMYKKLHDEIRKGRNQGKESNAVESFGGSSIKASKSQSLSVHDEGVEKENGLHDFRSVGVVVEGCEEENCGVNPLLFDDSEDDVMCLCESERRELMEVMNVVSFDDSDDDQREGIADKSFDGGKKSGGIDVGAGCSGGLKFDGEERGRSRWKKITYEGNGEVFVRGTNEGVVEFLSSGIGNEGGALGLKGRKSNGVAGRTELQSGFCEKNKDSNDVVVDDDDVCTILEEDADELQSFSSGGEENLKDYSDYGVDLKQTSCVVEAEDKEEEGEEDDGRDKGEMKLKRKKFDGIEILCDSNIGKIQNNVDMDDFVCVAKRTRSQYNSMRMNLGTVSRPPCVDEERLDDNGDNDEHDNVTYEAGDDVKKVRSKKWKTDQSRGGHDGDFDDGDGDDSYEFRRITRSQRRIIESRNGSRDEERLDDNGDNDEHDNVTYEAGDDVKKVRSKKRKTDQSRGGHGGDVDDDSYEFRRITRSQRRIIESRNGSRDEHLQDVCGRKLSIIESRNGSRDEHLQDVCGRRPSKRKRTRVFKEHEVVKILANSMFLDPEDVTFKENGEQLKKPVLPVKFTFGIEESTPPVKSEDEKQLEGLWADMALALCSKDTTDDAMLDENEDDAHEVEPDIATLCRQGKHELVLDEEIGLLCKYCSFVDLEIKYYVSPFDTNHLGKSARRGSVTMQHNILNELQSQDSGHDTHPGYDPCTHAQGTVWNLIPGIEKGMHGHQREGFEFLWKNIAGGICLDKLREKTSLDGGTGCIISHAPGTGKTRLTLVFLQTYMKLYPTCRPVIVAPCSMLLAWEAEFLKWGFDIPFHVLNNKAFSGKENKTAMDLFKGLQPVKHGLNAIRMVKLYSWKKERSILGISYKLFEELVGEERKRNKTSDKTEHDQVRKILLELPGLLVLDEGHTPRNDRSLIWKALSKVRTQKRIILSGTPFQNNFDELYNTLCLVKPKFANDISSKHRRAFPKSHGRRRNDARGNWASLTTAIGKVTDDKLEAQRVEELRKMIRKFVHVHKGGVLRERLPGLRDSVVILEPKPFQKKLLEKFKQMNGLDHFEKEYLVSVLSVHPSLLPEKSVGAQEFKFADQRMLEKLRSKPEDGVKTMFLMELIRLCQARNEKVLIFSQYLEPLNLVIKQLESKFKWIQGEDVLYMHGHLKVDERQTLIKRFNDANSEAKVLLASTRACSEGINLVGASRVVLLDVVWNPSVERQAISRAYRLGQEKVVYVYHLITSGTMEEEKYFCQVEKERLSDLVFDCTNRSSNHQKIVFDIADDKKDKILEQMLQHDKLKSMFKKIVYQPKDTNLVQSFGLDS